MSNWLKDFDNGVVDPLKYMPVEEARQRFERIVHEYGDINSRAKGADIGRVVVEGLKTLGKRPDYPPIFSINEQTEKLDAFLEQFGINCVQEIETSLPVLIAGCAVTVEEIKKRAQLNEREISFGDINVPAVRIHFVPQEM